MGYRVASKECLDWLLIPKKVGGPKGKTVCTPGTFISININFDTLDIFFRYI